MPKWRTRLPKQFREQLQSNGKSYEGYCQVMRFADDHA